MRALVAACAGMALLQAYVSGYAYARATHRLVHQSSLCDGDRVVLGSGAAPGWSLAFAPAMAVEGALLDVRLPF